MRLRFPIAMALGITLIIFSFLLSFPNPDAYSEDTHLILRVIFFLFGISLMSLSLEIKD